MYACYRPYGFPLTVKPRRTSPCYSQWWTTKKHALCIYSGMPPKQGFKWVIYKNDVDKLYRGPVKISYQGEATIKTYTVCIKNQITIWICRCLLDNGHKTLGKNYRSKIIADMIASNTVGVVEQLTTADALPLQLDGAE
ncbi:MAG: hypothetical protein CM1200mP39_26070 [Dehalococcoidia bacterium]|nr:MAG: hypothetical protein CM1200mP39_26070 [Dehalococcoidia bacterium]